MTTIDLEQFALDPYPTLSHLRESAAVHWHEQLGCYWVCRYDDVKAVLLNPQAFPSSPSDMDPEPGDFIYMAGAKHRRFRGPTAAPFARPNLRRKIEPAIHGMVAELFDRMAGQTKIELVGALAAPLPAMVMRDVLQMPELDEVQLAQDMEIVVEAAVNPTRSDLVDAAPVALERVLGGMRAVLARERAAPGGGLLTDLIQSGTFDDAELVNVFRILAFGGIETTRNLIANMTWALCANPDQLARLRARPALLASAIEESLRFLSPNLFRPRYAAQDVEIAGTEIPKDSRIYAFVAGANRDPEAYDDPDAFRIDRFEQADIPPHLAFGWGSHFCLGAHLSRLEATHAMTAMLQRFAHFSLADPQSVPFSGFRHRGARTLTLDVEPAPAAD